MRRIYDLGPFRLDAEIGALTLGGTPVMLGARAVAVLALLVEHAQDFVSKSRLIDAVWPGVIVEEGNLAVQINAIRRVLARAPGGDRWIETLIKRGYRFVGPVAEVQDVPAGRSTERRSNLAESTTSFVGRDRELAEIKQRLPARRLITIIGIGGIGKTRLALQAAAEVIDAYRDGAWLVELAPLRKASQVESAIAQVFGIQERTDSPPIESLRSYLRKRQVLLILDNCEHLLDASARIVDAILAAAKDVTILTTSREPLSVAGEHIYALAPLSLPQSGADVEAMRRSEAVRLFVERVQAQVPDFALVPERVPAIAELCLHLDGIPLALELAAARARSLSVEQINVRVRDRFQLLTGGVRTALPRQQTLRATLDWSYDLLTERERVVLSRLAIFPGSFTVEAASAVASDEKVDDYAAIDLLSQLVARSLVMADIGGNATRYRLLETTRAYAMEKLDERNETQAIGRRHAQFFRDAFEHAFDDWLNLRDPQWRARYLVEIDNLRSALDWALGPNGEATIATELAGASGIVWSMLGLFAEGAQRLQNAIARVETRTMDRVRGAMWLWLGRCLTETPTEAGAALERAIELYRRLNDPVGLGISLVRMSRILAMKGEFQEAEANIAEAWPLLASSGARALNQYHSNSGMVKSRMGDMAAAREHFERALIFARELRDELGLLAATGNVANAMMGLGDLDRAITATRDLVALIRSSSSGTPRLLGTALMNLAEFLLEKNDLEAALHLAREGAPLVVVDGSALFFSDHGALRAGHQGRFAKAALLSGYADRVYAENGARRNSFVTPMRERLLVQLREFLPSQELEHLFAEGAKLSEDEAWRLTLEE